MLLLAGILFVSGCAEDTQEETGVEEATPVEEVAVTEIEEEPSDEEEGIMPDEEPETGVNETAEEGNLTIVGAAEAAGYYTFASLVRDAGLEDTLNEGTYTVFAPTDEAFDKLPGSFDDLRDDDQVMNTVLTYHVVQGEYMASDLENGQMLTTVQTGELPVAISGVKVTIGNSTVVEPDIVASNGVIHGINEVLIPPEVERRLE
ncbi:fasciclin domain-containing protein [Methanosarcina soligelidi]|uniref:fasciclin domain-containing protein n=1 Tax=Methanosarcina soligelidi TaxID=1036677 RepID=UPI001F413131|nr:fasciclin domain-containing protein [Methanosarcina soligelidi]